MSGTVPWAALAAALNPPPKPPEMPPVPPPVVAQGGLATQIANPGLPWYAAPGMFTNGGPPQAGSQGAPPPLTSLPPGSMPPPQTSPGALAAQIGNPSLPWYAAPGALQNMPPPPPPPLDQAGIQKMFNDFMAAHPQQPAAPPPNPNPPNGPDG